MRRPPRGRLAPTLLLAMAVMAGCGNDAGPGTMRSSDATTTAPAAEGDPTTSTTGAAGGAGPGTGFTTQAVRSSGPVGSGLLADVEATADGLVDRVTFTFEGATPGYRVEYVERPIVQDGSGDEVPIDGAAVLLVHFEPASGFDLSGEGRQVYRGPRRLDLATRVVLDVVQVGDFEAVLTWAVGVDQKTGFRVRTTPAPQGTVVLEVEVPPAG